MIVSVPFYGIAWSNEFDAGKGSKSERGLGPEVWVGRWDSWKTSMTRLWPVVVLENFGAIERTPKTWIAGPGACRNNIHKEAHMLQSTCNPRQETQETQETRILHGENDDDWICIMFFLHLRAWTFMETEIPTQKPPPTDHLPNHRNKDPKPFKLCFDTWQFQ